MISVFDYFNKIRSNLNEQQVQISEIVTHLMTFYEDSRLFENEKAIESGLAENGMKYYLFTVEDFGYLQIQTFEEDLLEALSEFRGDTPCLTITGEDGRVCGFKIGDSEEIPATGVVDILLDTSNRPLISYSEVANDPAHFMVLYNVDIWPTFDVEGESFDTYDFTNLTIANLVSRLNETYSCSDIAVKAMDLVSKESFSVSNLKASVGASLTNLKGKPLTYLNTICDGVQGNTAFDRIKSFLEVFRQLSGGWVGATATSDTLIHFNDTDYTVNTSVGWPVIAQAFATATSIIGAIVGALLTPLGFALTAVGSAVGMVVETIKNNDKTYADLIAADQRAHDGFAQPFIQYEGSASHGKLPQKLIDMLSEHGFVKLVSGPYTVYVWIEEKDNSQIGFSKYYVEGYINTNVYYGASVDPTQDMFIKMFKDNMTAQRTAGSITTMNVRPRSLSTIHTNLVTFIDEPSMLPGSYNQAWEDKTHVSWNDTQRATLGRLLAGLLVVSYQSLPFLPYFTSNKIDTWVNDVSIWDTDWIYDKGHAFAGTYDSYLTADDGLIAQRVILSFLAWCCGMSTPDLNVLSMGGPDIAKIASFNRYDQYYPYWSITERDSDLNKFYAGICNNLIPAIKAVWQRRAAEMSADPTNAYTLTENLLENMLFADDVPSPSALVEPAQQGWTSYYLPVYGGSNCENPAVVPPTSTVSIWVRIGLAAAILVATAVSAVIIKSKVKKFINRKAEAARGNISRLRESYNSPTIKDADGRDIPNPDYHSKATYNALYKSTKRYNGIWGRFTGTSYDLTQDWVNNVADMGGNSALDSATASLFAVQNANEIIALIAGTEE